jgi:hypothetical protein
LAALLQTTGSFIDVEYISNVDGRTYKMRDTLADKKHFGVIPVPEATDYPQVTLSSKGLLLRLLQYIVGKMAKR